MKLADRMSRLILESAFDVLVRARALEAKGRSVIHLEIGEPDFPTPPHIVEAAKKALDEGWTHYGPPQGYPELREAIAAHVSRSRGISVGPQHVSVVPGGKPIIFFPMMALLEPGDEVKTIMFRTLPGKTKHIPKLTGGIDPTEGFDSHSSPTFLEWYLFDESQACPAYVLKVKAVEDTRTAADDE